jgi:hypothetical protein
VVFKESCIACFRSSSFSFFLLDHSSSWMLLYWIARCTFTEWECSHSPTPQMSALRTCDIGHLAPSQWLLSSLHSNGVSYHCLDRLDGVQSSHFIARRRFCRSGFLTAILEHFRLDFERMCLRASVMNAILSSHLWPMFGRALQCNVSFSQVSSINCNKYSSGRSQKMRAKWYKLGDTITSQPQKMYV